MAKFIGSMDSEEELQLALRKFDKDQDGYIPENDLIGYLTRYGMSSLSIYMCSLSFSFIVSFFYVC